MPITHSYVLAKPDPGDASLIGTTKWNANHLYPSFNVFGYQSGDDPTYPAFPVAGVADVFGVAIRTKVDLTYATQARIVSGSPANASSVSAKIAVQYSLDQATWVYLDGANGPFITLFPLGIKVSAWANLVAGAKADVWLRWVTREGTGSQISIFNSWLQVR